MDDVDEWLGDFELDGNTRMHVDDLRYLARYLSPDHPPELREDGFS